MDAKISQYFVDYEEERVGDICALCEENGGMLKFIEIIQPRLTSEEEDDRRDGKTNYLYFLFF